MVAPVNRVSIQVARGSHSNLAASISEFEEGELLYAKDENTLYIIEDGLMAALLSGSGYTNGSCILAVDGGNADTGADAGLIVEPVPPAGGYLAVEGLDGGTVS
jgi:hypothetical protein